MVLLLLAMVENRNWGQGQSCRTGTAGSGSGSVRFGTVPVFFRFYVPNLQTLVCDDRGDSDGPIGRPNASKVEAVIDCSYGRKPIRLTKRP